MESKSQALINFLKNQKFYGDMPNATVDVHHEGTTVFLGIDSSEIIYQCKYKTDSTTLGMALELISQKLKEKNVDEAFLLSCSDLEQAILDDIECHKFFKENMISFEQGLSLIRKALQEYWGYFLGLKEIDDLICRCNGIGKKQIVDTYYSLKSDAKQVFSETNIAGVCGTCKSDVNSILNELELSENELFGKNKEYWQNKIQELINEYYLVCPPEFSELSFAFISITPRNLKMKCTRVGQTPARPVIQESINNFFKGQLDRDIPISIVI